MGGRHRGAIATVVRQDLEASKELTLGNIFPSGNTTASAARTPGHLDLFVVGPNGGVQSTWWDDAATWAEWFPVGREGVASSNTNTVTVVARTPDNLDLFVVGEDGGIYSTYWNSSGGWASDWFQVPDAFVPNGNTVTAVARTPDNLDLFVTGHDGGVYSTYWNSAAGWGGTWFRVPHAVVANTNTVTVVARTPDNLDLFVVGEDGGIYSTYWNSSGGWASDWFQVPDAFVPNGNTVTAVARTPDNLDLFVTGHDGGVYSTYWNSAAGWGGTWFRVPHAVVANTNTVTVVARTPDNLDLFVVGEDGGIYSTYWNSSGGWASDWFRVGRQDVQFSKDSSVTAVARTSENLDLFAVGVNGGVYSAYWNGVGGWGVDWFRIGYKEFLVLHYKSLLPISTTISTYLDDQHSALADLLANFEIRAFRGTTEDLSGNAALAHLTALDVGECRGDTTDDQDDLFANRNNAGNDDLVIYLVQTLQGGKGNFVGCASHPDGRPGAAIVQRMADWLTAHEVGHVLDLNHVSETPVTNKDFLMFPNIGWTNTPPDLSADEVSTILDSDLTRACSPDRSEW